MRILFFVSFSLIFSFQIKAQGISGIVDSNNIFAFKLYKEVNKNDGSIFYSPYSISLAVAMQYAGARNETEKEISHTLNFRADKKSFCEDFKKLNEKIDSLGLQDNMKLNIASSMWVENKYKLLPSFSDVVISDYHAEANEVDYINKPGREKAVKKINEWVEDKTYNKIKNILGENDVTSDTKLILINAIYFKSNWENTFERGQTRQDNFYVNANDTEQVEFMHTMQAYDYYEDEILRAIEIPYFKNKTSMIIFLPKNKDSITKMEARMNNEYYKNIIDSLKSNKNLKPEIKLSLPQFKITVEFQMKDALSEMGMPSAFYDNTADFSGMTGDRQLHISKVIHQAFIDITEEGTEAAAATGIITELTRGEIIEFPPVIFKVNHPFIFVIRDNETGSILFMGKISKPNGVQ